MKMITFIKTEKKTDYTLLMENIKLNLEKGYSIFIGTKEQLNEVF